MSTTNSKVWPHSDFGNLGNEPKIPLRSVDARRASPVTGKGIRDPEVAKKARAGNYWGRSRRRRDYSAQTCTLRAMPQDYWEAARSDGGPPATSAGASKDNGGDPPLNRRQRYLFICLTVARFGKGQKPLQTPIHERFN